uniref:DUF262 domain-containing protein n=1 Tax=uncultured Thiotrichaceae bacterium TaxID=298394 RepID=A0A6S6UHV9_9GAMM|nr:MAG: DUF262 domain-containing protein [uncultured Thiotrichaceae bacterium]
MPNVTPKGQKKVILDWFRSENKPRNRDDIAKIIRSGSVNHASFYINELIEEGSLVRIDYTHYSTPEHAFMNAPVENIFSIVKNIMTKALRPVDIGIVAENCNAKLHLSKTKAWYLSLIKLYCKNNEISWHFHHNLMSFHPINNFSIHSVLREIISDEIDNDELLKAVLKSIFADKQTIKNAINNVRNQSAIS